MSPSSAEIVFKQGDTEHYVEVEILYDGVREMREAFTLHLKPDENMVAETKVKVRPNLYIIKLNHIISSNLFPINNLLIALVCQSADEQSHNLYRGDQQHGGCHISLSAQGGFSVTL